jgi:hypothetical protein
MEHKWNDFVPFSRLRLYMERRWAFALLIVMNCHKAHDVSLSYSFAQYKREIWVHYYGLFNNELFHSMRPAREGDIPVRVKNSYNPKAPGTLITKQREMDKVCIILLKVYSAIVTSSVWH